MTGIDIKVDVPARPAPISRQPRLSRCGDPFDRPCRAVGGDQLLLGRRPDRLRPSQRLGTTSIFAKATKMGSLSLSLTSIAIWPS
jgi:hypothetical protein